MLVLLTFVARSRSSAPWFWPLVGACAGIYLFYHGFCLLQRKRLIMNTPASKVRSAAMGLVEISGLAAGPYTINAPITGLPCFYYHTMVWQWKREGKNNAWVKVADESLHVPFYLDDNTGRVLVNPQGAEMEIHRDFHDEFSQSLFVSSLEIPANITNFLLTHGIPTDQKIKVEEYCIKPKNALFVLGTLAHNPGLEVSAVPVRTGGGNPHTFTMSLPGGFAGAIAGALSAMPGVTTSSSFTVTTFKAGDAAPETTRISGDSKHLDPAQQAVIMAALTKAGITSPTAWAAAGIDRPTQVAATGAGAAAAAAPAAEQFDLHPPTVLMKGTHDPAFFISWRSQRDVVKSLGWKSALMIWGGPALTLLCVYMLASEFGWW